MLPDDSFPVAATVIEQFACENIESSFKRKVFGKLFQIFGLTYYCESNRQAMLAIARDKKNPFDVDVVSKNFKGIYPELSYSIILEKDDENDCIKRAAKLIYVALQYEENNASIFSKTVNLTKCGKSWKKEVLQTLNSSTIAIIKNQAFYKLQVKADGKILSLEKIYAALKKLKTAEKLDNYGLVTACQDDEIAKLLKKYSLQDLNEALFIVAIDEESKSQSLNDFGRYLHILGCKNKDYRKSIQFLIDGNCNAGITFNLFSGIEGVAASNFASFVALNAQKLRIDGNENDAADFSAINFSQFKENSKSLDFAGITSKLQNKIIHKDTIFRIDSISKNKIKKLNVSPDAFFHVALHLFYFKKMKKVPFIHNFIDLRTGENGTISRYLTTSNQIKKFLQTKQKSDLLAAFVEHKNRIEKIRAGHYPLHFLYHYLFRPNKSKKPFLAVILLNLFIKDFIIKFISPTIWASNIPALPGVECLGRFATKLSFVRKDAIAGHYLLFDDHIKICFLANSQDAEILHDINIEIEQAMLELVDIISNNS